MSNHVAGGALRLILIEDNESDALLLLRDLTRHGYRPQWCRIEAAEQFSAALQAQPWDLVISDYVLPSFSAPAALAMLHQSGHDLPFIIVSGTIDEESAINALRHGAHDFIGKQSLARLVPAIERELREAEARRSRRNAEAQLVRSERYFRALSERAADLVIVIDRQRRVRDASPALNRMLGYRREDLIGRPVRALIYPGDRARVGRAVATLAPGAQLDQPLTLQVYHRDGRLRTLEVVATNLLDDLAVEGMVINAHDITRQAEAEAEIRSHAARAESLLRIAAQLNAHLDRSTVLHVTCAEAARALGANVVCVALQDAGQALHIASAVGQRGSDLDLISVEASAVMANILDERVPVASHRAPIAAGGRQGRGQWSAIGARMRRDGQQIGLLVAVFSDGARPITDDDQALLGGLADQAGLALDNADLLARLQASNAALAEAYDATLEGWVHALDLRDKETEGHTRRVTAMTLHLARAMDFDEEQLTHIYRGALLHDIGKLGIPDRILQKAGPLDEAEWALMRMHPVYAYEWLQPIAFLRPALAIPYCHHEKWDGSGYPRGLRGEEIPLAARIFALVDIWDALRSERSYKAAFPEDQALAWIAAQAGKHLDQRVIDLFISRLPELRELSVAQV
jgi:PAS domain S-box-containing protein